MWIEKYVKDFKSAFVNFKEFERMQSIYKDYLLYLKVCKVYPFTPPKMVTQEFWISGNEVSKSYLHEMAQFIVFNLLNITKHNASSNIDNIMPLIDAAYYNQFKTELVSQNEYVIANSISRTFFLSAVNADKKGEIVV